MSKDLVSRHRLGTGYRINIGYRMKHIVYIIGRGGKSPIPFWEANLEVNYFLPNAVIPSPKQTFGPFDF